MTPRQEILAMAARHGWQARTLERDEDTLYLTCVPGRRGWERIWVTFGTDGTLKKVIAATASAPKPYNVPRSLRAIEKHLSRVVR